MSGTLRDNVRRTVDLRAEGFGSADHASLGFEATMGLVLPTVSPIVILARRTLYPTPGAWRYCGVAHAASLTAKNWLGFGHQADMGYQYAAARCRANGFRSAFTEPTRLDFDGAGDLITPRLPAWPVDLNATAIAGGKYRIHWNYAPWGQGEWPTDFEVYEGPDGDNIDYGTPLGTLAHQHGVEGYEYETGAYGDVTRHAFAVRARNSAAVAEKNTRSTQAIRARATGPAKAVVRSVAQRGQTP